MKTNEQKARSWIEKEYWDADLEKWVFTQLDMIEAFKAGMVESTRIAYDKTKRTCMGCGFKESECQCREHPLRER